MKITGNTSVDSITPGTRELLYKPVPEGEEWKVNFAKDLIEMKSERGVDLTKDELEEILYEVTT